MRKVLVGFGVFIGIYLFGRALVEPFVIDMTNYHNDWGGPSLAGVLAVHCGPGLLLPVGVVWWLRRRRSDAARSRDVAPAEGA